MTIDSYKCMLLYMYARLYGNDVFIAPCVGMLLGKIFVTRTALLARNISYFKQLARKTKRAGFAVILRNKFQQTISTDLLLRCPLVL